MAVYGVNKLDVYPITHVIHVLEYNLMRNLHSLINVHRVVFAPMCFSAFLHLLTVSPLIEFAQTQVTC